MVVDRSVINMFHAFDRGAINDHPTNDHINLLSAIAADDRFANHMAQNVER